VFTPAYPIVTERLSLRRLTMADLDAYHDIQRRADVARYLYWEPRTRAESRESLAHRVGRYRIDELTDGIAFGAVRNDTGQLIGSVSLNVVSQEHSQGEIGYVLHPDHHGNGFATEAAIVLLRMGFEQIGLHRIVARCDARNIASTKVMERAGMHQEAHLHENEFVKNEWQSEIVYAALAKDWLAGPGATAAR
jgi:RimJ/RimL family protein N-acetyltransferase